MVYPDTYELGQANQALRILVNAVNARDGMAAERAFLPAPAFCDTLRAEGLPLFSLESCAPVREFDAVGITLPHELAATNVLETLDLAGIPLHADARAEDDPFVLGGGPVRLQPRAVRAVLRRAVHRRGRGGAARGAAVVRRHARRGRRAAPTPARARARAGCYVPSLYRWLHEEEAQRAGSWAEPVEEGVPARIEKRLFAGLCGKPRLGAVRRAVFRGGARPPERGGAARMRARAAASARPA